MRTQLPTTLLTGIMTLVVPVGKTIALAEDSHKTAAPEQEPADCRDGGYVSSTRLKRKPLRNKAKTPILEPKDRRKNNIVVKKVKTSRLRAIHKSR